MSKKISRQELKQLFVDFKKNISFSGVTFANVLYFTNEYDSRTKTVTLEDGTKKKEYALQKLVNRRITIGSSYESKIRRIQQKQNEKPDFKAGELVGKFYPFGYDVPIVAATKNPEFEMLVIIGEHHVIPETQLFHNGVPIDRKDAEAQDLFTPSYFLPKQTAGRGEVNPEFDFTFNTLGFDKIVELHIAGEKYIVEN